MNIFDRIIAIIAPFECLGCRTEGKLLCEPCKKHLSKLPSRCYKCHKITANFRTCETCRKSSKLYSLRPVTEYAALARTLTSCLKFQGAQAAAAEIAAMLPVGSLHVTCVVVPVPTATSRVRQRGYDQAKLIARNFARANSLEYMDCLSRLGQSQQVGSNKKQRYRQLTGAFRIKADVTNRYVVLIDDVSTTGATLEAAASCLKQYGAKRVYAQVFAQA